MELQLLDKIVGKAHEQYDYSARAKSPLQTGQLSKQQGGQSLIGLATEPNKTRLVMRNSHKCQHIPHRQLSNNCKFPHSTKPLLTVSQLQVRVQETVLKVGLDLVFEDVNGPHMQ